MNQKILHTEIQKFINDNLNTDISKLIFKGSPFQDITIQELVEQIEAKKRCKNKLPTWFKTENIYYPNKLNIEQTSSELTANHKANLIAGNSIIDLTGGFGVDCYYFTKQFKEVTHCEINKDLSKIVTHNYSSLNAKNIATIATDGLSFLTENKHHFDWIYIDPSRRNDIKGKVFLLKDCLPNVPEKLDSLFEYSNNILIKVSPILDIKSAISELQFVKEVHVIAVANEVKELLFILEKGFENPVKVIATNIKKSAIETFETNLNSDVEAIFSEPLAYLYEPNSAILKAGLFNTISHQLNISKLHKNSHLYTNRKLINFPGRRFKIIHKTKYDKKAIAKLLPHKKANITTRNFPETVAQIRKKTGIKDGGNQYLFFTTDINNNKIVLICEKN